VAAPAAVDGRELEINRLRIGGFFLWKSGRSGRIEPTKCWFGADSSQEARDFADPELHLDAEQGTVSSTDSTSGDR